MQIINNYQMAQKVAIKKLLHSIQMQKGIRDNVQVTEIKPNLDIHRIGKITAGILSSRFGGLDLLVVE
jgi:uncharacterized protein YcfJ